MQAKTLVYASNFSKDKAWTSVSVASCMKYFFTLEMLER